MGTVPPIGFVLLAALIRQDYHQCFLDEALEIGAAIQTELKFFTVPLGIASMIPFALFGGLFYFRPRAATAMLWIAATAVLFVPLYASGFHDCDRKGTDSYIWPLIASLPAFLLWLVAIYLSNSRRSKA